MDERKSLLQWGKEHRKELVIAGIGIGTMTLIILGIRNRAEINAAWDSMQGVAKNPPVKVSEEVVKVMADIPPASLHEIVTTVPSNSANLPFEVSRHIRNLHEGWHASSEKIAEALKNNINLMEGQTWVDSYMKGGVFS